MYPCGGSNPPIPLVPIPSSGSAAHSCRRETNKRDGDELSRMIRSQTFVSDALAPDPGIGPCNGTESWATTAIRMVDVSDSAEIRTVEGPRDEKPPKAEYFTSRLA